MFHYGSESARTAITKRIHWIIAAFMVPLLAGLAYRLSDNAPPNLPLASESATETETSAQAAPSRAKTLGATVDFIVRRNDTLERIFRQLKLNLDDLSTILSLPGVQQRLGKIRPGESVTVIHDDGSVHAVQRRISDTEILSVTRGDSGFAAEVITTPIEIKRAGAHGTINSSLFVAARAAGISPDTTLRLANDIFGWDIDFALDIRPGDRFSLIYEQKYREGQYLGDARILAAEFINDGEIHRAVYYASPDGKIADYFTPEGRSMRQQFLRAPLDFTRISSNFNPSRRHPILNSIRAHKGVDYAAPTGTVIKAAGDGRISFVGVKGGYGKVVMLEHGGGISTLYGHMSRFVHGVRHGQRVKQGDTIGYVGSSGAATGPHLHYEYLVNGAHQNPRTVRLPDAAPIPAVYAADFSTQSLALLAELERTRGGTVATAPKN
jgi:murein DD-endopeptidase MepM/ murein hydrolase activator NlpD